MENREGNQNIIEGINPLIFVGRQDPRVQKLDHNLTRNQMQIPQYLQQYNFPMEFQSQLQWLALNDQQEIREIARHVRAMERDVLKSNLKDQQQHMKQIRREIHEEIVIKENAYYYAKFDGENHRLCYKKVFSARIQNLCGYKFHGSQEVLWQVTVVDEKDREHISPLYTKKELVELAKLRTTILSTYDCTDNTQNCSCLWKWIQKALVFALNHAEVVEIPSEPGWYLGDQSLHFYSVADEDTTKYTDYMRNFRMPRFGNLQAGEIVCTLLENLNGVYAQNDVGMLLHFRFLALLGRLTGTPCFQNGIVICGEKSEEVARHYLVTMANDVDIVNLDSDRMGKIRERVCNLQDTPVIFLVNDSANRSVKNRLREVISWMQTSCVDGSRVKVPFAFCFKRFSALVPLDDMLVLDGSNIRLLKDDQVLAKFQCLVVEKIEQAGELWRNEIANRYKSYATAGNNAAVSMARTVNDVLCKMFNEPEVDIRHRINLRELFEAGEEEMKRQLSGKRGRLSDVFKEQVINLLDKETIFVADRDKSPVEDEWKYIYYDEKCYYFTEKTLRTIGIYAGIDRKAILLIKQELDSMSMLKKYRSSGQRTEELHIDFRVCSAYGQRKDLSGLAIWREFFDEIGGIALCERG